MTVAVADERRVRVRSIAAGGLVVVNLFLVVLNLDKHGSLPFSTGVFGAEQATDGPVPSSDRAVG
ncbi:MAG: hypothetical protein ACFCVK_20865 [Acidimicrobiales bacterium]